MHLSTLVFACALLTGCTPSHTRVLDVSPSLSPTPPAVVSPSAILPKTMTVRVGGATVKAEVADTDPEREAGLMGRTSVPKGTGMVFTFDRPWSGNFYMFQTLVPLTAVFADGGRVVGVYEMAPCTSADPQTCPLYGPGHSVDTVLETAPATIAGKVRVGDRLTVGGR